MLTFHGVGLLFAARIFPPGDNRFKKKTCFIGNYWNSEYCNDGESNSTADASQVHIFLRHRYYILINKYNVISDHSPEYDQVSCGRVLGVSKPYMYK
jgi:hypothetical protein